MTERIKHNLVIIGGGPAGMAAAVAAYERGDCYVSEVPEFLELYREDDEIVVKTRGAERVLLRAEGRYKKLRKLENAEKNGEARFAYHPEQFGRYFRIELTDTRGKKAFSRAYFTGSPLLKGSL